MVEKLDRNAACFVSVESKALRSKEESPEMKNANQEIGVPGHASEKYLRTTI
jgi:hypothetical protein